MSNYTDRPPFILVPKPPDGWPDRVQSHAGHRYETLGGRIFGVTDPTNEELMQLYDYWAGEHDVTYDKQHEWVQEIGRNSARIIESYLGEEVKDCKVLDLACGTGLVTNGLSERLPETADCYGLDLTTGMLLKAKEKADKSGTLVRADARHLPFKPDSFNALVGSLFINHISSHQDRLTIFENARRVLKQDGVMIIVDSKNNPDHSDICQELGQTFPDNYLLHQETHYNHNSTDGFELNYHVAINA